MDGLAVISNGLAVGRKGGGGEPFPVEEINIGIQMQSEFQIGVQVESEIDLQLEVV
jgi:hypothetical protein